MYRKTSLLRDKENIRPIQRVKKISSSIFIGKENFSFQKENFLKFEKKKIVKNPQLVS